jgi:hypothetical protein
MTPVVVRSAAVLTAGTVPTKGVCGKAARSAARAEMEAALQATTISLASRSSRKRVPASTCAWISRSERSP